MININLIWAILACVLNSGFQHGYNLGVTNAPQKILLQFINNTQFERDAVGFTEDELTLVWAMAVSIFSIGAMFGAMVASPLAERLGRKLGLLVLNILVGITAVLYGFSILAKSYEMIIVGRFIIGIDAGINACLAPMYLIEISPLSKRGAIGSTYQLLLTISILISQLLGLPYCLGTATLWPILFSIILIPAVFQSIALLLCPESPKYLLAKGKEEEAGNALKWLRRKPDVEEEKEIIKNEIETAQQAGKVLWKHLCSNIDLRYALTVAIVIMLSQQFSGINSVIGFSTEIFNSAGLTEENAMYATLLVGVINVIITVISMWLVEKMGRRPLYILGLIGLLFVTIGLTLCLHLKDRVSTFSYVAVALVYLFIVIFASGIGSIPWFMIAEIFSQDARSRATSISVAVNWGSSFVVMLSFLPLKNLINEFIFLFYAGLLVIFITFSILFLPETKNKPIEEIQSQMEARRKSICRR